MHHIETKQLTGRVIRVHRGSALTEITLDVGGRELAALVRPADARRIEQGLELAVHVDGDSVRLGDAPTVLAVWVASPLTRRSIAA